MNNDYRESVLYNFVKSWWRYLQYRHLSSQDSSQKWGQVVVTDGNYSNVARIMRILGPPWKYSDHYKHVHYISCNGNSISSFVLNALDSFVILWLIKRSCYVLNGNWKSWSLKMASGGARSRNLGGQLGGKLIFWGGKIEFLKRYCYTATGGRIS
jgi:hypothetical protein